MKLILDDWEESINICCNCSKYCKSVGLCDKCKKNLKN